MKKQILFLAMFTLAFVFAGTNAFGQTYIKVPTAGPTCITPTDLDAACSVTNALNPVPGQNYTYTVTTSSLTNDVRFFVINNEDLKTASPVVNIIDPTSGILASTSTYIDKSDGTGKYILALGPNNAYNVDPVDGDATGTGLSIDISWKNFDGNQPHEILLVAYVEDDAGCTNNLIVWRIIPKPSFTLDIVALGSDGNQIAVAGATGIGPCVSPIESATYASADNVSGTGTLTVDYGENWVYFLVNANNFVDSWQPEFQFTYTGNATDLSTGSASWTYLQAATDDAATWNPIDVGTGATAVQVVAGGSTAAGVPVNAVGDKKVSASGGECIVVRVQLNYGTVSENVTSRDLTLAVNGIMYDNDNSGAGGTYYDNRTLFEDLHYANCLVDNFTNDRVTQTITARPEIDDSTPNPDEIKTGDE